MLEKIKMLVKDEEGASMAEYAILISLITFALVGVITPFRVAISTVFTDVTGALTPAP